MSAEHISKIFWVLHNEDEKTVSTTSQLNRQDGNTSRSRNFTTNDRMLQYRRLNSIYFTDTIFITKKVKSTRGNIGTQIYVSDKVFLKVYPAKADREFIPTLKAFVKDVGVTAVLVCDGAKTQTKK